MLYDYSAFLKNAKMLSGQYRYLDLFPVGESVFEKKIYCLKIGVGRKKILLGSAFSGLEYNGAKLLMNFLECFADAFSKNVPFFSKSPVEIFTSLSLYFLPMINPDGVDIALHGLDITNPHHRHLISISGIHSFCKVWQANGNGVDLQGAFSAEHHLPGTFPESEPEISALLEFINTEGFDSIIHIKNSNPNPYYDFNRSAYPEFSEINNSKPLPKKSIQVELEPEINAINTDTALSELATIIFDEM